MRRKSLQSINQTIKSGHHSERTTGCSDFNQTVKSGHCLHSKQESGFHGDPKIVAALLTTSRLCLLGLLGRLLSVMTVKSFSLRSKKFKFFNSSSGLWCSALKIFKSSVSFLFFGRNEVSDNVEHFDVKIGI